MRKTLTTLIAAAFASSLFSDSMSTVNADFWAEARPSLVR